MLDLDGQLSIRATGGPDELLRLLDWVRHDDALRGRVHLRPTRIRDGEMGDLADVLIVALGSGGITAALAGSLSTWLTHRRSDITVTVTRANGDKIELDAKRVTSTDVLQQIQRLIDPPGNPR